MSGRRLVELRHRELTAEVVERDAHVAVVQLAERGDGVGEVVHDRVLADLDADAASVGAGRAEDREDARGAVGRASSNRADTVTHATRSG